MRILEIEQLFQTSETLNQVLEQVKGDFEQIDYYGGVLQENVVDNPEECLKAINILTGVYMNIKPVLEVADAEKTNREIRNYCSLKIQNENAGTKFVDASGSKEASASVADYRRVRNILEGYVSACEKAISSLQSVLKYLTESVKMDKGQ